MKAQILLDECPEPERLQHLLNEALESADAAAVESHIERCGRCQHLLEMLTADRAYRPAASPSAKLSFHPGEEFLQSLRVISADHTPDEFVQLPAVQGYEVLRELGRGGMGVVYLARHLELNRLVALKLVPAAGHGSLRARFRREAEVVARLENPSIVRIHEIGESGGWPFLALEYVDGTTLDRLIAGSPQHPAAAAALVERLAIAIHSAHRQGIVHRDLKPANILIPLKRQSPALTDRSPTLAAVPHSAGINESLTPKIADFGLAKMLDDDMDKATRSGQLLGTPGYVAPEQITGPQTAVSAAADVYALGAILYELLTGRPPFQAAAPLETLLQVLHRDPTPPSQMQPKIPRDLETICLTCLNKSPSRRYASAEALAEDLRRFLEGKPVKARPLGIAGRAVKWVRRRPTSTALIVSVFLAVAFATLGLAWLWREAEMRANIETASRQAADLRAANFSVDRYLTMCDEGEVARGVTGLADAVSRSTAVDPNLDWVARANIDAWQPYLVPLRMTLRHPAAVSAIAFSPDGLVLATVSVDNVARLWDLPSGKQLGENMHHPNTIVGIAIRNDGKLVATACQDGIARAWDASSGRLLHKTAPRSQPLTVIAFSPTDHLAVIGGADGAAFIWNTDSGETPGPPLETGSKVEAAAISINGLRVMTGSADGSVRLWDVKTGKFFGLAAKHRSPAKFVLFSPDGSRFATGSRTELIGAVPPAPGAERVRSLRMNYPVTALAYESHGDFLAFGGGQSEGARGFEIAWWLDAVSVNRNFAFEGRVNHIAVSPGARCILVSGEHWRANLVLEPYERSRTLRLEHAAEVTAAAFSPNYTKIATASQESRGGEGVVYIWDAPLIPAGDLTLPHRSAESIELGDDGHALTTSPGMVCGWELLGKAALGPKIQHRHDWLAWPGGDMVWLGSGQQLTAHSLRTGKALPLDIDCQQAIRAVAVSGSRNKIGILSGQQLSIHNSRDGALLTALEAGTDPELAALSTSGDLVASGDASGRVAVWVCSSGQPLGAAPRQNSPVRAISFLPEGQHIAVAYQDKTVHVYHITTFQETVPPLIHSEVVKQIAVHPEGRILATVCLDGSARFWDAKTGKPIGPPILWKASGVTFSHDGECLWVASPDRDIRSWKTPVPLSLSSDGLLNWAHQATGKGP